MEDGDIKNRVQNLSIQVAATQLLLRSLISCTLVEDDEESNLAIEKLINSISRRASLGKANAKASVANLDSETLRMIDDLEKAIKTEAIKLVADLRRTGKDKPS